MAVHVLQSCQTQMSNNFLLTKKFLKYLCFYNASYLSPEKLITHGTIVCILYVKFMCFTYPAAILWKNTMNDGGTQQNNTRPLYDSYLLALFAWGSVIGDILLYPVIRKRSLMLGGVNMIRYWWKNVINERRNKNRKRIYTGS